MDALNAHDASSDAAPVLLSWSGGKDSALALWQLQHMSQFRVTGLLTTLTLPFERISMHGVRRELLERQAAHLGMPLQTMWIDHGADNAAYEASFTASVQAAQQRGCAHVAFGDLHLVDVRAYRERLLTQAGLSGVFPLWGRPTQALLQQFIDLGFRAVVVCVDPRQLPAVFVGREIDQAFLEQLPLNVDPCGEQGEYHSFVYDGPTFSAPVKFTPGERVQRENFWFCDLLPA